MRLLIKTILGIVVTLGVGISSVSCGQWVYNYDLEPNIGLEANMDPSQRAEVILAFRSVAKKHAFEIVVKDVSAPPEKGWDDKYLVMSFHILMRNKNIRVDAGNYPNDHLDVAFYKAKNPRSRPSDEELGVVVSDFASALRAVASVTELRVTAQE